LPRRTDASKPADWIEIAEADLAMVRLTAEREISWLLETVKARVAQGR
jgi:hypothetical protein